MVLTGSGDHLLQSEAVFLGPGLMPRTKERHASLSRLEFPV
jgi:hypothetical protein